MKSILTFSAFFVILQVSAQSKFGVGIVSSADMTSMIGADYYGIFENIKYDKVGLGYQGGLRFRYQLNSKVSFQSGLSIVSHQLRTSKKNVNFNPRQLDDPYIPTSFERLPTFRIIQVPLLASFYIGNKLKIGGTLGLAYNYIYRFDDKWILYNNVREWEYLNKQKQTSQNQFVSALLGVGVEYSIKKFAFRAEPTASYQLFYFNNEFANKNYNLYSVGFNLSGYYFF